MKTNSKPLASHGQARGPVNGDEAKFPATFLVRDFVIPFSLYVYETTQVLPLQTAYHTRSIVQAAAVR